MALRVCEYCGKAWISGEEEQDIPICPPCEEELNGIYKLIWSYLRDAASESGRSRKVSAQALSEEIGIDIRAIELLVKMGRIQTDTSIDDKSDEERKKYLDVLSKVRMGLKGGAGDGDKRQR
ncbi:MAG: hypothetical protein GX181_09020 [Synergistaceae bacterium]|nr:hypothetical protein [Synergistota bacterium]NLM72081.1 hypothetical protein [Synergistaceae bacterium]